MIGMGMGRRRAAIVVFAAMAALLGMAPAVHAVGETPRTFNLYIRNHYEPGDVDILARYDALGLDVDTPTATLNAIKAINPSIKLLAYIPINGTYQSGPLLPPGSKWREMYEAAEANGWWLLNTQGGHIYDHAGKYTINITTVCPPNGSGQTMLDWYPQFIVNSVLQNGAAPWDGVILDDVWVGIWFVNNNTSLNPLPIDADQDGVQDDQPTLDQRWKDGNELITERIRNTMPAGEILIGNGGNQFYHMNGAMIENFPFRGAPDAGHPLGYTWTDKMFGTLGYFSNETNYSGTPQRINVVNAKWQEGGRYSADHTPDYGRHLRFCLASSMLRDGYFSMDFEEPTAGHHSLWWEPEFDKPIGTPTGAPYQVTYNGTTLWRRDYTNGAVLLNNNYTTFLGSAANGIPPIGWVDARILLTSEMWAPESVPPAAINDLVITRTWPNQLEIRWTNVGDNGTSGQAVEVQARYSTSPITEGSWNSATVASGTVIPELPGVQQLRIITGLSGNTQYHVAVKTKDMAGNWSAISNVPSATTVVSDATPPNAITNLAVLSTTSTGATVQWTTTGDDGNTGTASSFDLRYATFPLNASNFNSGAAVVGEPAPGPAGSVHSMALYGMTPYTTYYFAIKVGDEMPNWSSISNIPSAATQAGDITPPADIIDLQVIGVGANSVTLQWTAPGDDGNTGRGTQYDLRYSPNPMTTANYSSANFITSEPGPQNAGTVQTLTINGFGSDRTYWFAMRTSDEFPNWSGVSNIVSVTTNQPLPGDTTPPAAVTNLAVTGSTTSSITLSWTAPGDDGSSGTAASYDLRYSTSAITAGNFATATAVAGEPVVGVSGSSQGMTVTGLSSGIQYHFALKTADEIPNWSSLSNTPSGTTQLAADTTPPAAVSNLSLGNWTSTSVQVSWTAPGDDNTTGTAASYDLRYSTSAITAASFGSATAVTGEPVPAVAGTTQSMTVSGLTAGTTYFFALKTSDEVPNTSAISNVPTGSTLPPPDVTAPGAVANLTLGTWTQTSVVASWTSPGDDNTAGTAASYDLRFSTSAITAANFNSATPVTGEPVPAVAGTTQNMTVPGLAAGTTYFFALKTSDEVPNTSAISNVPTGSTLPPPDVTAPAAVANLALGTWTQTSVVVSWTSPGDDNSAGTATSYDLRYSTSAITAANFGSATAVTGEPVPAIAGTTQNMTVSGLTAGTTYFFALKTSDEVPNTSAISNVPTGSTLPSPDVTAPSAVANLALGTWTQTSVVVSWTAPGDDNAAGTAASYDLRFSTSAITAANFGSATPVTGEPVPAVAGTTQNMTVSGLTAGTTYFFALKTSDEVNNTSVISNVPTGSTLIPPDTTPPAAVTSLALGTWTQTSVLVSWTAPGDDNSAGTATAYDLRWSTSAITSANFGSATAVTGEPVPAVAGTTQSMTVSGLTAGTTYFFALKASDEVPNTSAISNVATGSTLPPPDVTAPAAVANLSLGGWTQTSVVVSWTAPGDDNAAGTAAAYDLRYSTSAITGSNFGSAAQVAGEPVPAVAGTTQNMTVTGLTAGTTYFFALKTIDEVPNTSGLSNVPSGPTLPPTVVDTTPPAAVTNLAMTANTMTSLTLGWTAPGDDNTTGTATTYVLRWSTAPITAANFGAANEVTGMPAPAVAGTNQSVVINNLVAGTTYYVAMRTADEVPNWSGLSNVLATATVDPPDATPPAAVTNLASLDVTLTSVTIRWTAPGDDGTAGTAASYDVRFRTSNITAGNFGSSTAASGEPAPAAPGSTESFTISGLAAGTTYWIALKTADEKPNWSSVSNVISVTTPLPPDVTAPSAVGNLAAGTWSVNSVWLTWTSTGDDGSTGVAASFDIRMSTAPITAANFAAATPVTGEPAPASSGTSQNMQVSGLAPGTTYWFAMTVADEVPNTSGLSNVATGSTTAPPDVTPPAVVNDLVAGTPTVASLTLTWSAPGDDGSSGTAATYDLRRSTLPITAANFASAVAVSGEPVPGAPGSTQSMTVSGLVAATTYYFALRTADEASNWSGIGNVAVGATLVPPDVTPPAAVTNLALGNLTPNGLTVSWTAPGDDGHSGDAAAYDLRWSTGPIASDDFAAATPVSPLPAPLSPGSAQSVELGGLVPGQTVWVALRTRDEAGNWSSLSNVPSATPPVPSDETAPAPVATLAVSASGPGWVTLAWSAPGDDGTTGLAEAYDLRLSASPITAATFGAAAGVAGEPVPGVPGTVQSMTITDLLPGSRYWAAIKTVDESGNWSSLSNVVAADVPAPPDVTPPTALTLTLIRVDTTSCVLAWLATGDDGTAGRAARYEMMRSESPLDEANFTSGIPVPAPVPAPSGTPESMTATGLAPGSTWFFAVRALDEAGNAGPLSAPLRVDTKEPTEPPDTAPPLAPTGLSVSRDAERAYLSWSPNVEVDIVGYHVYRRQSDGPWQRRTESPRGGLDWHDPLDGRAGTWEFRVTAVNVRGEESAPSAAVSLTITDPGIGARLVQLAAPAPNPFAESTTIRLAVPPEGVSHALVVVLDVRGRAVRALHDGPLAGGECTWAWDGADEAGRELPNGVYLVIASAGDDRTARKIVLSR